jgi:GTPase-associated protein 1, N-terminal domain type 1/Effector-associated domain 1
MRFGVAFFGDLGRKHGLLASTPEYRALFIAIVNRTDRPGYTPPDRPWPPYLSGFAHRGHYYLMRTFADDSASRSGMVYTAALAAPVEQFALIEDLKVVVDALPPALVKQTAADPLPIELADLTLQAPRHDHVPAQLAQALIANAAPVIWGDPRTFDEVIVNVWGRMWPSVRKVFSFRMSFDPNDIDQQNPPTLVTTLPEVRSRWVSNPVISTSGPVPHVDAAAAVLTGDPAGDRLSQLRQQLQCDITEFRQLRLLQALAATLDSAEQSFSSRRSQLQLAAKLSPDPNAGSELKAKLADDLCARIPEQASAGEIRGLRNIPWGMLAPGHSQDAFAAVAKWLATNSVGNSSSAESFNALVADAFNDAGPWGVSVQTGLQRALESDDSRLPATLWSWIVGDLGKDIDSLLKMYLKNPARESHFADACPKLTGKSELCRHLLNLSKQQGWSELHASVALNHLSPSAAMAAHLKSLGPTDNRGIGRICSKLGNKEFLALSVEVGDLRLVDSATHSLAQDPDLWATFSPDSPFWRAILTKWLSPDEHNALPSGHSRHVLASTLIHLAATSNSTASSETLWNGLVSLSSDWSDLDLPSPIWNAIPTNLRPSVFDATTEGWLAKFLSGTPSALPGFPEFRRRVTEETRIRRMLQQHRNASTSAQLFEQFAELPEHLFLSWLQYVLPSLEISQPTALRIGTLIATRRWRSAAEEFASLADRRPAIRIGLEPCVPLFSMLRRIRLIISGLPQVYHGIDLWQALQELGLQLYSYGPGDRNLWQRAGGDPSDLPNFRSGREAWNTVIQDARNGRHTVTISSLIEAMRDDFPNNPDLREIARLSNESQAK